jgi:hypothetical protein
VTLFLDRWFFPEAVSRRNARIYEHVILVNSDTEEFYVNQSNHTHLYLHPTMGTKTLC